MNMRKRLLSKRSYGVIAALLLALLLLVWFGANQDDYYNTAIEADDFTVTEDGGVTTYTSEWLMLDKGTYTFTIGYTATDAQTDTITSEADQENTAETEIINGEADYEIEKVTETMNGEAVAMIISALAADAEGNAAPVLAETTVDPAAGQAELTITLSETTRGICVVVQSESGALEIGVTSMLSTGRVWHDTAFFLLCIVALALLFLWLHHQRKNEILPESLAVAVCLIAGVVASLPVLRDFLVYGHDLAFHLTRIESIKDGLLSGQFPVRIDPTFLNGYGYASSVMYGDLLLYIPALLRLCGVSMLVSYQAFIVLLNVATAYLTYRAVKAWTGKAVIGLIAGTVYTLGIYRLMTLFTRAAAGEALAMLFYPMVIVGIAATVLKNSAMSGKKGMIWLVIGMTGMLQTHLISLQIAAIGCAVFTLGCVILRKTSWNNILRLCAAAGITTLINLWFIVPFLSFSQLNLDIFTQEKQIYLHAVYWPQLFASFVEPYGMTTFPGTTVEMPLSVGLLLGVGLILWLFAEYQKRENRLEYTGLYAAGRTTGLFAVAALLIASVTFPWTYVAQIPIVSTVLYAVQFPWRYLGAASALLSIVFAIGVFLLFPAKEERHRMLVLGCLLLAIFNAAPFIDACIQSEDQTIIVEDKYDDFVAEVYLPGDYFYADTDVDAYLSRDPVPQALSDGVTISDYDKDYLTISFAYTADAETDVELPLYGYPVYRALLDTGEELPLTAGDNGILTVTLPEGAGHVTVTYAQPWYYTATDVASLLAILALVGWSVIRMRRRKAVVEL